MFSERLGPTQHRSTIMAPRGLIALAALMVPALPLGLFLWPASKASPVEGAALWGAPDAILCDRQHTAIALTSFSNPPRLTIRGAEGAIYGVRAASIAKKSRFTVREAICLSVPLRNPNLLSANGVNVSLNYHTQARSHWAKTRIRLQANDGSSVYDWMGGREATGELSLRVDSDSVLSRGKVFIRVQIEGIALDVGEITLRLDSISLGEG
jgi:hypothetical protein